MKIKEQVKQIINSIEGLSANWIDTCIQDPKTGLYYLYLDLTTDEGITFVNLESVSKAFNTKSINIGFNQTSYGTTSLYLEIIEATIPESAEST